MHVVSCRVVSCRVVWCGGVAAHSASCAVFDRRCARDVGPMIHLGGIIGGSASQSRSRALGCGVRAMDKFATDKDRRDFIATGTA